METFTYKYTIDSQVSVINNFLEVLESCLRKILMISKILANYHDNEFYINFDLEIEFEVLKLNSKYIESILNCFIEYKSDENETHQIRMLKLNDFILYEFKRLRIKYEEIAEFYFSLDQENKYMSNIKKFKEASDYKPTKIGYWFLKLLNNYLWKMEKYLNCYYLKEFKTTNREKEKIHLLNEKIQHMCKTIYTCLFMNEDEFIKALKNNEMLMSLTKNKFVDENENKNKWINLFTNIIQNVYSKIRADNFKSRNIFVEIKNGFSSLLKKLVNDNGSKDRISGILSEIQIIELIFENFEQNSLYHANLLMAGEPCKINEVFYMPLKNFEKIKLLDEKDGIKKLKMVGNSDFIKMRILTNQFIKINYDMHNLQNFRNVDESNKKEINFFGLLLKVSKELLIPNCNVILHVNGGGFLSQSSESHLSYLNKWATETDSVIISIDYKLSYDNKYPILFDSMAKAYEIIISNSMKLFNFNINKLILYSDSVGCLMAFDIIKYAIEKKLTIPDAAVFVSPIPNLICEVNQEDPYEYLRYEETSIYTRIRDSFIDLEKKELLEYKQEHRLNFFLTAPDVLKYFPKVFISSAANEPIKKSSSILLKFLMNNNVNVSFKQLMYYSCGYIQISSFTEDFYKNTLEYALSYIKDVFNDVSLSITNLNENSYKKLTKHFDSI